MNTIMAAASRLRRRRQAPARVWLQFLGYLASLIDVLPDYRLDKRPLHLHLLRHYSPSRDLLTRLVPIPPPIRLHLVRWSRRGYLLPPTGGPALYYSDHRCFPTGMGWPLPGQYSFWGLSSCGHGLSHQCARVPSCPPVTPFLPTPATPAHSSHSHRQCDCGGIHKQTGGHALHQTECPSGSSVEVVQTRGNFSHSVPHPGPGQVHSRLPVPGPSPALGVDSPPDGHGPDSTDFRPTASGPVRVGAQCPPPQVLL